MKPGMTEDSATLVRRPHYLRHLRVGFIMTGGANAPDRVCFSPPPQEPPA